MSDINLSLRALQPENINDFRFLFRNLKIFCAHFTFYCMHSLYCLCVSECSRVFFFIHFFSSSSSFAYISYIIMVECVSQKNGRKMCFKPICKFNVQKDFNLQPDLFIYPLKCKYTLLWKLCTWDFFFWLWSISHRYSKDVESLCQKKKKEREDFWWCSKWNRRQKIR